MNRVLTLGLFAVATAFSHMAYGAAEENPGKLAKVRGNVVLSDRWSAKFFEVRRDGKVVQFRDYPSEGGEAELFEIPLFTIDATERDWSWRNGYLPILSTGKDTELVASMDNLYVRQGTKCTKWPGGSAITKLEFDKAVERVTMYWERWFADGKQLPEDIDGHLAAACKSSLIQALTLYSGRHPHYGAGFYRVLMHDAFPPTTIATVDTLLLYGHTDEAVDTLLYYLKRYVRPDGTIVYYGPSLSEYGGLMWVAAMAMEANGGRAKEIALVLEPLVKRVLEMFQLKSANCMLGDSLILSGVPEADLRGRPTEYFHNNYQVLLGLEMVAAKYRELKNVELANELDSVTDMFGRLLEKAYQRKRTELGGMPFMTAQKEIPNDIQSSLDSGYANYRYYPELIETGMVPKEDVAQYCKYRGEHNGEYRGMSLLNVTNCYNEVDNWPIASYGRGLLEYGMKAEFERVLKAHYENYISDDTFTAYEQVTNAGEVRTPVAPQCVPVQLALPRMVAWKAFGYRKWDSYYGRRINK